MKKLLKQVLIPVLIISLVMPQILALAEEGNEGVFAMKETEGDLMQSAQSENVLSETERQALKRIVGEENELKSQEEESIIADDSFELPMNEWAEGIQSRSVKVLSASQIANYANSLVGNSYASGYCLRFVADVFADLGAARSSACCAYNYGNSHIISTDINSIPVGADIFFGNCGGGPCSSCKSSCYGHIGIYVGDGYFVHATGGKVQKSYLPGSSYWKSRFRGWGYHSNISVTQNEPDTCNCSDSYAGDYICTSKTTLNIRTGHGTSFGSVGSIPPGATVHVSKGNGIWAHVSYNGVNGYASMQYLEKKNNTVTANLHVWISDEAMGGVPNIFTKGTTYYLCYELLDASTGKRLSADHSGFNYIVTEDIIRPDGTSAGAHSYSNSDNNWISLSMGASGNYKGIVTVIGDFGITTSVEWNVQASISTLNIKYWLSEDKLGDEPSEYTQGTWYYSCYELTDSDTGIAANGFSPCDYTLTEEVYNPSGSLEYSYTYNNADTNWIGFRAKYEGTYTLKYIVKETIGGGQFEDTFTAQRTVKANPTTITASKNNISLSLGGITSTTINIAMVGYYNGSRQFHWERSNSNVSCSWGDVSNSVCPLTVTANSVGTTTITLEARDSDTSTVLAKCSITVTVSTKTYKITYNANGGNNAPPEQTKTHGTALAFSSTIPKRFGYNFLGWSKSPSASAAAYVPGGNYTDNADAVLYAVWSGAKTLNSSLPATSNINIGIAGTSKYFIFKPAESAAYQFESTGDMDTYATLYDAEGKSILSNDDGGSSRNFMLTYNMAAGKVYYIEMRMYSSNITGSFNMTASKKIEDLKISSAISKNSILAGETVIVSANVKGGGGNYTYSYLIHNKDTNQWSRLTSNFVTASSYTWTAGSVGNRGFFVEVKDSTGKVVRSNAVNVKTEKKSEPLIINAGVTSSQVSAGGKVMILGAGNGGSGSYTYSYLVHNKDTNQWSRLTPSFIKNSTYTWTAGSRGSREFFVEIKDGTGKVVRSNAINVITRQYIEKHKRGTMYV